MSVLHAQLVESIEVRVTNVDVVVTDRAGKPVTGLTKNDFELFENGKLQTLTNFYAIERAIQQTAAEAAAAPQGARLEEHHKRRIVFFIDNDSLEPSQRNRFIDVLDREIARLVQPGDEATVILWNHRAVTVQPFTGDVAALQKSLREQTRRAGNGGLSAGKGMLRTRVYSLLEAARANPIFGQRFYNEARDLVGTHAEEVYATQQRLLRGLAATVSRLAGVDGKKVMVFATGTLPERAGLELFEWVELLFRPVVPNIAVGRSRIDASSRTISRELEKLAKLANTDGVTMYLIDAGGAIKTGAETREMPDSTIDFLQRSNTAGALQMIANITGGIALTGSDNFKFALDTISRDLDSYYSLGYKSADDVGQADRRIVVKVRKPGLVVRSRRSWAPKSLAEQMQDRVVANVFHSGIASDFGIELTLRDVPRKNESGLFSVPLRVTIPSTLTLLPDGGDMAGGFSVYLVVGGANGELSNVARTDHPVRCAAAEEKTLRASPLIWDVDLTVRAGEQMLSVAVVDRITNQAAFTRKIVDAH